MRQNENLYIKKINSELVFSQIDQKVKVNSNNKKITKSIFGKVPDFFGKI